MILFLRAGLSRAWVYYGLFVFSSGTYTLLTWSRHHTTNLADYMQIDAIQVAFTSLTSLLLLQFYHSWLRERNHPRQLPRTDLFLYGALLLLMPVRWLSENNGSLTGALDFSMFSLPWGEEIPTVSGMIHPVLVATTIVVFLTFLRMCFVSRMPPKAEKGSIRHGQFRLARAVAILALIFVAHDITLALFQIEWFYLGDFVTIPANFLFIFGLVSESLQSRRLQEVLVQTEEEKSRALMNMETATRSRNFFLAMVSHEIRTPLNGLEGIVELLGQSNLDADQKKYVSQLRQLSRLISHSINDILLMSRMQGGDFPLQETEVDLPKLIREIADVYKKNANKAGNTLTVTGVDSLPAGVRVDRDRLWQVLANLLNNAIKHTREGSIGLICSVPDGKPGRDYNIKISVTDTGSGIPSANFHRIFEPFFRNDMSYTRKQSGLGLGLPIARGLARKMGGDIEVTSTIGKGSQFHVYLNLPLSGDEPAEPKVTEREKSTEHYPILLVEDEPVSLMIALKFLEHAGYEVESCRNGEEAVELVNRNKYSLVFMDIQMPIKDGLTATREIRGLGFSSEVLPIVALSAHTMPEQIQEALDAGMTEYLTKPVNRITLLEMVARFTSKATAENGTPPA